MRAPAGARTLKSFSLIPAPAPLAAIRTIGNGCINRRLDAATSIVCAATAETPAASVTRKRTTCWPGVLNDVPLTAPPPANTPVPERSHANAVIGLAGSVELESSETRSPTCGALGDQVNDAEGPACAAAAGARTEKLVRRAHAEVAGIVRLLGPHDVAARAEPGERDRPMPAVRGYLDTLRRRLPRGDL